MTPHYLPKAWRCVSVLPCDRAVVWKTLRKTGHAIGEPRFRMERPPLRSSLSRNLSYLLLSLNCTPRHPLFSYIRIHHSHFPWKEIFLGGAAIFWKPLQACGLGYPPTWQAHNLRVRDREGKGQFGMMLSCEASLFTTRLALEDGRQSNSSLVLQVCPPPHTHISGISITLELGGNANS